jgi:glycine oxidase
LEFEWRVPGFLVIDPERLRPSAAEAAAAQQEQDFTVQAVDGEQLALLEPALRPGIPAGLLYPSEAHLHPVKAALSLARGLQLKGGRIRTGVQALSLETSGGKVVKVHTTAGSIEPGCVIAATGWDTRWLAELRPPALPLNPLSGQLIATDPLPPLLKRPVAGRFLVLQLRSGEIVTGGTVIPGEQATPDAEASREFAAAARELVPALRDVPFPHAWCGTRAGTPDGLPIVDRLPAAENLFVTTGHFKKGVLLAPACGKLLSDWVATDCCPEELEYFSWRRFAGLA